MTTHLPLKVLLALIAAFALSLGATACGDDEETTTGGDTGGGDAALIEDNPDNNGVAITVGSKNFAEQIILGEIYAQALTAAGYDVSTQLNLGDSQIALKALEDGEISAYPEYASTALLEFFDLTPEDVPADAQEAYDLAQPEFESLGITALPPTPLEDANSLGLLTSTAEELGVETVSDLEGQTEDLVLAGSPECRQRSDCLLGLEEVYGLQFSEFTPIDIGLRYDVLDSGDADLSILFTSDGQLSAFPDKYTLLEDDQGIFPSGNILFLVNDEVLAEAGPDLESTVEAVGENLTNEVMQELNARVEIDRENEEDVAADYLQEFGYVE